jgi:hypothetical protein
VPPRHRLEHLDCVVGVSKTVVGVVCGATHAVHG